MSDTADDCAVYSRLDAIRASREPFPCGDFGAMSKSIPLCDLCGWDEDAHIDAAHELALEMDDELS